jgi:hypothetical protein
LDARRAKHGGVNVTSLLSSGLLAASLIMGQTDNPVKSAPAPLSPAIQQTQNQAGPQVVQGPQQQPSRPIMGWFNREDRPIISKIQGWWKRDQKDMPASNTKVIRETTPPPITNAPTTTTPAIPNTPTDYPRKMPNPQSQNIRPGMTPAKESKTDVQQTTLNNLALANHAKSPILPAFTNKIGRDEKFEWITGQLEIENGNYILYYATPETVDKYNGRVVLLQTKNELANMHKGDLISVRGDLSQRPTTQGMMPIYRINHAANIERGKS